jgi:hypothetical protein
LSETKGFPYDTLTSKGSITVKKQAKRDETSRESKNKKKTRPDKARTLPHNFRAIFITLEELLGTSLTQNNGINSFQVRRIGQQGQVDLRTKKNKNEKNMKRSQTSGR